MTAQSTAQKLAANISALSRDLAILLGGDCSSLATLIAMTHIRKQLTALLKELHRELDIVPSEAFMGGEA